MLGDPEETSIGQPLATSTNSTSLQQDDHSNCSSVAAIKKSMSVVDALDQIMQEDDSLEIDKENQPSMDNTQDDSEEEDIVIRKNSKNKSSLRINFSDDSDDEDSAEKSEDKNQMQSDITPESKENPGAMENSVAMDTKGDSDSSDEDDVPLSSAKNVSVSRILNNDLFDAEMDSDDGTRKDKPGADGNSDSEEKSERSESEQEEDAPKKLNPKFNKKGGAAKTKSPRTKRQNKKDELTALHSESQRLVRESVVRIPYHQPKPANLQDFLKRTKEKLSNLGTVNKGKQLRSKSPFKAKLEPPKNPKPLTTSELPEDKELDTDLRTKKWVEENQKNLEENMELEKEMNNDKNIEKKDSTDVVQSNSQTLTGEMKDDVNEDDTLPDLVMTSYKVNDVNVNAEHENEMVKPEQDSGILTTPVVSGEESNSNDNINEKSENAQGGKNDQSTADHTNKTEFDISKIKQKSTALTPKLAALSTGLKNFRPKLGAGADDFIDLDLEIEQTTTPVANPGVAKLMERFVKHSKKKSPKEKKSVELSYVTKETNEEAGQEELKLHKFTFELEGEEKVDPKLNKPGAKLQKLKEKLCIGMRAKREAARQQRVETYALDNEEGYEGEEEEEEEEILSDEIETSEEEEDIEEEEYGANEKEREENPFVDEEADEDDNGDEDEAMETDEEDEMNLHLEFTEKDGEEEEEEEEAAASKSSSTQNSKTLVMFEDSETTHIAPSQNYASQKKDKANSELSDRPFKSLSQQTKDGDVDELTNTQPVLESEDEQATGSTKPLARDVSVSSADTSFEMVGSLIPAHQGGLKQRSSGHNMKSPDIFTSTAMNKSGSASKMSDLTLPIEDSQDLYNSPSLPDATPRLDSQSFHFSLEDETQSQLLDSDGFLKFNRSTAKKPKRQLDLGDGQSQDNMDELLGLCSGNFVNDSQGTQAPPSSNPSKRLFDLSPSRSGTQKNMDELLGLCSGRFTESTQNETSISQKKKRKHVLDSDDEEEEEDGGTAPFEILSNHRASDDEESVKDELSSDEDEMNKDSDEEEDEDRTTKFDGFTVGNKHGKIRKEFVDEEAELSGSECGSDENFDIDEKDDILEYEEGDADTTALNEEELRNQVGRVHMKTVMDSDKREMLLFQERFLPDGDLYSEGGGRMRRFRWNNIDDDNSQGDMFGDGSDNEADVEAENEEETQWRVERYEREKWLEEQKANGDNPEQEEDSQFIKLGKVVFKPKLASQPSIDLSQKETDLKGSEKIKQPTTPKRLLKIGSRHSGSFLNRSKAALAKLAEMYKPVTNPNGPRNSKNFVFSVMSPDSKDKSQNKKPAVKRANSIGASKPPASKKPRLERSQSAFSEKSIFNLI